MTEYALVKLLGGVRAAIFAALMLVFAVGSGVQSWRLADAQEERDLWAKASAAAHDANATNVQTIADLKAANEVWADLALATEQRAAEAVDAVARERDALAAELDERRRERRGLYEQDQEAAAWSRARVPDSVARQLRE